MKDVKLIIVRIGAGLLGLIGVITGALAVYGGAGSRLGAAASSISDPAALAVLDNDFRFFAACWFIIGVGLLLGAVLIHRKPDLVQIGLEAVFLGGLARLFAFTEFGNMPQFYAPIAIELVVPPVLLLLMKLHQRQQSAARPQETAEAAV